MMIRNEVRQIQKEFNCGEFEAVNFLLQLIAQEDIVLFEEDLEQTLPQAA